MVRIIGMVIRQDRIVTSTARTETWMAKSATRMVRIVILIVMKVTRISGLSP